MNLADEILDANSDPDALALFPERPTDVIAQETAYACCSTSPLTSPVCCAISPLKVGQQFYPVFSPIK